MLLMLMPYRHWRARVFFLYELKFSYFSFAWHLAIFSSINKAVKDSVLSTGLVISGVKYCLYSLITTVMPLLLTIIAICFDKDY